MLRVQVPSGEEPRSYVWSNLAQHLTGAALNLSATVYAQSRLPLRTFEAARLRIAQINGCEACQVWRSQRDVPDMLRAYGMSLDHTNALDDVRLDENFYQIISGWRSATELSDQERIAVEYAERFALDPQGLNQDDDFWERARPHFPDELMMDLTLCVGAFIAFGRLQSVLGVDASCAVGFAPAEAPAAAANGH